MEAVNEDEEQMNTAATQLEQERSRMRGNVQSASAKMGSNSGHDPKAALSGPSRKASLSRNSSSHRNAAPPTRSAPYRSSSLHANLHSNKAADRLASMRGASLQRANSSRLQRTPSSRGNLIRAHSSMAPPSGGRRAPGRTSSVDSTKNMRAYREGLVSSNLMEPSGTRGNGLERHTSDISAGTETDLSCFTMDSVNLRKTQLVADPLEDINTYNEDASYADHESVSRASQFSEYPIEAASNVPAPPRMGVSRTPSRLGAINIDRNKKPQPKVEGNPVYDRRKDDDGDDDDDDDDRSFGTMTSGLTTDFADQDEFYIDDSDEEDEESNNKKAAAVTDEE